MKSKMPAGQLESLLASGTKEKEPEFTIFDVVHSKYLEIRKRRNGAMGFSPG